MHLSIACINKKKQKKAKQTKSIESWSKSLLIKALRTDLQNNKTKLSPRIFCFLEQFNFDQ